MCARNFNAINIKQKKNLCKYGSLNEIKFLRNLFCRDENEGGEKNYKMSATI